MKYHVLLPEDVSDYAKLRSLHFFLSENSVTKVMVSEYGGDRELVESNDGIIRAYFGETEKSEVNEILDKTWLPAFLY